MQAFFIAVMTAVMTNPKVEAMLQRLVKTAVDEAMAGIGDQLTGVENRVVDLGAKTINQVDALDGKMGNMQQQLVDLPAQVIESVSGAVENSIRNFNPFR